jgi:hypothetical protein
MWSNIEKWGSIVTSYEESVTTLRERVKKEAHRKVGMPFSSSLEQQGIDEGWFDAVTAHAKSTARGDLGLNDVDYRTETNSHGITLFRSKYALAVTSEKRLASLKKAFNAMLTDIESWPEYDSLKRSTELFISIRSVIQDELTTIIMRRVVSGRCRYCPY